MSDGPIMPRREVWIDLPAEYGEAGMKIKIWMNPPTEDANAALDNSTERNSLSKMILEHNGWRDFDGEPLPPVTEQAFWDWLPLELFLVLMTLTNARVQDLPNSLLRTRTN